MKYALTLIMLIATNAALGAGGHWIVPATIAKARPSTTKPTGADPLANTWTCYRANFNTNSVPASASIRIAVDSKYWLWINGQLTVLDGGLKRGPTRSDSYLDTIDLSPFLKKGSNCIAILTWYFGKEGFSHISSGMPGLYVDSNTLPLRSDAHWKAMIHPAFGNTGKPTPNYRLAESNVRFDGSKEMNNWTGPGFDDSAWLTAVEIGQPPCKPWGQFVDRPIPLFRFSSLRNYENAAAIPHECNGKVIIAKLPHDAQVTAYLKIDAPEPGKTIDMRTDSYMTGEPSVRSEYVTRTGVQEFESPAWMSGHEVHYTIPPGIKIIALKYRESGYDTDVVGSFHCDDPFYNTLWTKASRTLYVNMRDNYFDCPDRERAQWWGDIVNDLSEAFYSLDMRSSLLARKGLRELAAWQRPDGSLFAPIPTGNYDGELPPQMLATVGWYGAWTYYFYSEDDATIRRIYPAIKRYLALWKLGDDGLVIHRKGQWDWEDWGENIDAPLLDNAWFCLALKSAAAIAKLVGANDDIAAYQQKIDSIQAHFDKALWTSTGYRSPNYKGDTDDRGNAMAILAGLAPAERNATLRKVLLKHRNCSPYMERFVSEAQFTLGDNAGALTRMKERYAPMVNDPLTTLWEQWKKGDGTYNHGWSGGPLILLCKYVAGITPTSPGFAAFDVAPHMASLKHVDAGLMTTRGAIDVSFTRDDKRLTVKLTVPPQSTAHVILPTGGAEVASVRVNSKSASTSQSSAGDIDLHEPTGTWTIEVNFK